MLNMEENECFILNPTFVPLEILRTILFWATNEGSMTNNYQIFKISLVCKQFWNQVKLVIVKLTQDFFMENWTENFWFAASILNEFTQIDASSKTIAETNQKAAPLMQSYRFKFSSYLRLFPNLTTVEFPYLNNDNVSKTFSNRVQIRIRLMNELNLSLTIFQSNKFSSISVYDYYYHERNVLTGLRNQILNSQFRNLTLVISERDFIPLYFPIFENVEHVIVDCTSSAFFDEYQKHYELFLINLPHSFLIRFPKLRVIQFKISTNMFYQNAPKLFRPQTMERIFEDLAKTHCCCCCILDVYNNPSKPVKRNVETHKNDPFVQFLKDAPFQFLHNFTSEQLAFFS